jgi:thioesterase domain-containing protein
MAAHDVELIRRHQPGGPYTLCGYSFGARVAFEAARQLEHSGERVDHLLLIAPGSPQLEVQDERAYLTILFTVFAGTLDDPALHDYLSVRHDEDSQVAYFVRTFPHLDPDLTRRIMAVVRQTYRFKESTPAMAGWRVAAPVTIFQARGDDRGFVDTCNPMATQVIELQADHYSTLKEPDVHELLRLIAQLLKK